MHSSELGSYLKLTREEMGLTLNDLEAKTNIWSKYLKAIDDGNFSAIPEEFYRKGFIKQYARQLGLDTQEVMSQYQACFAHTNVEEKPVKIEGVEMKGGVFKHLVKSIKMFILPY